MYFQLSEPEDHVPETVRNKGKEKVDELNLVCYNCHIYNEILFDIGEGVNNVHVVLMLPTQMFEVDWQKLL